MQLYNALFNDVNGNVTLRTGSTLPSTATYSIADSLVVDSAGVYWCAIISESTVGSAPTVTYLNLNTGATGTPTGTVTPSVTNKTTQTIETQYDAIASGTGYSIGDALLSVILINSSTITILASAWVNASTQSIISAPSTANIVKSDQDVKVSGTVTANAGTNMSTAALALETGGNLAALTGSNNTGVTQLNTGSGALGWLSSMWSVIKNFTFTSVGYANVNLAAQSSTYSPNNSTNGNSTAYSLANTGVWRGTLENVINQPYLTISVISTQNVTLSVTQYLDSGGTIIDVPPTPFTITGGIAFSTQVELLGNYFQAVVVNASGTTTTLYVDSYYTSILPLPGALTQAGNLKVAVQESLPTGSATIGSVNVLGGNTTAVKVDGSAVTQPVSGTVAVSTLPNVTLNALPTGSATIGSVNVLGGNTTAVKVDGSAVTQPVSGTVAVSTLPNVTLNALPTGSNSIGTVGLASIDHPGVLTENVAQVLAIGPTSVQSSTTLSTTNRIILVPTVDCWVQLGSSPSAAVPTVTTSSGSFFLPASCPSYPIAVTGATTKIAVISNVGTVTGFLSILESV